MEKGIICIWNSTCHDKKLTKPIDEVIYELSKHEKNEGMIDYKKTLAISNGWCQYTHEVYYTFGVEPSYECTMRIKQSPNNYNHHIPCKRDDELNCPLVLRRV